MKAFWKAWTEKVERTNRNFIIQKIPVSSISKRSNTCVIASVIFVVASFYFVLKVSSTQWVERRLSNNSYLQNEELLVFLCHCTSFFSSLPVILSTHGIQAKQSCLFICSEVIVQWRHVACQSSNTLPDHWWIKLCGNIQVRFRNQFWVWYM